MMMMSHVSVTLALFYPVSAQILNTTTCMDMHPSLCLSYNTKPVQLLLLTVCLVFMFLFLLPVSHFIDTPLCHYEQQLQC